MGSLCGASDQQKAAQSEEANIAQQGQAILKLMQQNYGTVFGEDQNILQGLKAAMEPIMASNLAEITSLAPTIAAGPNQYGYSAAQDAAMRTQATEQTAGQSDQSVRSIDASAATGRGSIVPSGATQQLEAMARQSALNQNSALQTGITESGFQLGQQNYDTALSAEANLGAPIEKLAGAETGVIGAGTTAGSSLTGATNSATNAAGTSLEGANAIQSASNAWLAPLGGLLGGVGQGIVKKV